ncbi:alpha-mannosidase 2-like [Ruditapes philippinarum]|uniref:alpha-mannosidase 2-like n=1 Tax=Ruditapes philippinarum TaxID=129788 RepID=UPI00295C1253|nr:alpha-mannosidase 2-like [Ruditapes philippinarum]
MSEVYRNIPFDNPYGGVWKQGWQVTYPSNLWNATQPLKVLVVPHSHTDPGWLMTYTEYYTYHVKDILNNMLMKLEQYPEAKFIFAEISFFHLWWDDLIVDNRLKVQSLLDEGRLEIVTGGWVMADEASTHYFAMLDQLIEGHQWLSQTLGVKPTSGWAIDPFGHSSTMAYMLGQSGFNGMVMQRVHYAVKKYLAKARQLEFMWRQIWDSEGYTDMLSHVMPFYSYDIPHTCGPDPAVCCEFDFARRPVGKLKCPWKQSRVEAITEANVEKRSRTIVDQWKKKAMLFKGNVVLVPLGDDFRYQTAKEWDEQFTNYLKLFEYINSNTNLGVQAQFGTLSDYFRIVHEEISTGSRRDDVTYPEEKRIDSLTGDFFAYADRDDHYWSGYFTSRPFQKHLSRKLESHLRGAEILFTLASTKAKRSPRSVFELMTKVMSARRNLALFQHHDGITGTSRENVVKDYTERLVKSLEDMKVVMRECAFYLTLNDETTYNSTAQFYNLDETTNKQTYGSESTVLDLGVEHGVPRSVMFYNSLGYERRSVVSVLVNKPHVVVRDNNGRYIKSQVEPFWTKDGNISTQIYQITFEVTVSGLGIALYTIQHVSGNDNDKAFVAIVTSLDKTDRTKVSRMIEADKSDDIVLENNNMKAVFNGATGLLQLIFNKREGVWYRSKVDFLSYGTKASKSEKSGAYIFLPDGPAKVLVQKEFPRIYVIRGPIRSQVHVYSDIVPQHIVTLYNSTGIESQFVDIQNIVDVRKQRNFELAIRITTDIVNTDRTFYTDLNGFQIQKRKVHSKLPLQGNVYPFTTMAFIQDDLHRHFILTANSLGFSNPESGVLEVMLDRRLNQDDNRGLLQGVVDNKPTPSRFRLLIENCGAQGCDNDRKIVFPSPMGHQSSLELIHPLFTFLSNPTFSGNFPLQSNISPLTKNLPCDVHMLNLRTISDSGEQHVNKSLSALILHRVGLDCTFDSINDNCENLGENVTLSEMFRDSIITIDFATETSLTMMYTKKKLDVEDAVVIKPMDIKTLVVNVH